MYKFISKFSENRFSKDSKSKTVVQYIALSTLRLSLTIKSFTNQKIFYRSDILHDFVISSFYCTLRENLKILGFNRNIEELIFISFCFKSHLEVPNGQILGDIDL